jgi:hypothetical protein
VATFAHFLVIKEVHMIQYSANILASVYVQINMDVKRNALKNVVIALQK